VFDADGPGPSIVTPRPEQSFFQGFFAIWYTDPSTCYSIDMYNVLLLLGLYPLHITTLYTIPTDICEQRCHIYPEKEGIKETLQAISQSDMKCQRNITLTSTTKAMPILPDTTSITRQSQLACSDTALIIHHLKHNLPLVERDLADKTYYNLYQQNCFNVENDLLQYYEYSRTARLRQRSLKLVPISLRRTVIVACQSSPVSPKRSFEFKHNFGGPACYEILNKASEAAHIATYLTPSHMKQR
jgi:hypothetical protein